MGKKNKLPKPTLAESKSAIIFGAVFLLLLLLMPYAAYRLKSSSSVRLDPNQVPVYFKRVENARPFPQALDPAQFQIASVREGYSVAKEIPDVLAQQPCYCYCQRQGHRSLLDCFASLHYELPHMRKRGSLSRSAAPTRQNSRGDPGSNHSGEVGKRCWFELVRLDMQIRNKGRT
jgi:hypothetical protein